MQALTGADKTSAQSDSLALPLFNDPLIPLGNVRQPDLHKGPVVIQLLLCLQVIPTVRE